MSSEPTIAFVWCWLPGADEPVVSGRLSAAGDIVNFNYGQSYLAREDAIPLYLPELPLERGLISPLDGLRLPGCIADAMPDAWGRRVVMQHMLGTDAATEADLDRLGTFTYLLESGSDRVGALDFQESSGTYVGRAGGRASLEELMNAAERVDEGRSLTPELDRALLHGSSIGGARPKALLEDDGRKLIAKFSSSSDEEFAVVKGEYMAMELARRAGLDVAAVEIEHVMGKDVLLVDRFDRVAGTAQRKAIISALTMLALPETTRPEDWSYVDLVQIIRERFTDPQRTLRELFSRISFNILVGNTDDHPRNHAAFWDGELLTLTPAYDICPQRRAGREAHQLMAISPDHRRDSRLALLLEAHAAYQLSEDEAWEIIDHQLQVIESHWDQVCELADVTEIERRYFWRNVFLNPYSTEGYSQGDL
ncbi:MAG: type II toxin-antitoxin system HipA family toxin [Solirubrobacterales bacterium]